MGKIKERTDIHAGHRKRLRERARKEKLRSFQPHEVLELMLMQVIPQRDVNPTAHLLIDRFGSVSTALRASEEELTQVKGIGPRSAQWLRAMGEMASAYKECRQQPGIIVTNSGQAVSYIKSRPACEKGAYMLVCLDRTGRVLKDIDLPCGKDGFPSARDMVRMALLHHAAQVFTVHFSFGSGVQQADHDFTMHAIEVFRLAEIMHLDHFICAEDGYFSARRASLINVVKSPDSTAAEKK